MNADLQAELVRAIGRSLEELEDIASFALAFDEDLRSVYGLACTKAQMSEVDAYLAEEWPVEIDVPFVEANETLKALADAHYAGESPELGPEDDHRRPWKAELYGVFVAALQEHRRRGTFPDDVFIVATSHGPSDWFLEQIDAATKTLNRATVHACWRTVYFGESIEQD